MVQATRPILIASTTPSTSSFPLAQSLPGADDGTDADLAALAGDVVAAFPPEVAAYFRPGYATHVLAERIVDDDGDAERLDTDAVAAVTGAPAHSASS